jgi:acyl-CoA synthetase (AMP-forming)/AMP-acid ligase II
LIAIELFHEWWLRTDDLGRWIPSGYLQVTGLLKDVFIRGSEKIHPVEVEACLLRHPKSRL